MKVIHQCADTLGWKPVPVASHSNDAVKYVVHCNPWNNAEEYICECPGYLHRGHCRHQAEADATLCKWHEQIGPEVQDPDQRRIAQCPRCGGPTFRQVIDGD